MIFLCSQGIHALVPAMQKTYSGIFLGKARPRTRESMKPMSQNPVEWPAAHSGICGGKHSGAAAPFSGGPLELKHHLPSALLLYKSISHLNLQLAFLACGSFLGTILLQIHAFRIAAGL